MFNLSLMFISLVLYLSIGLIGTQPPFNHDMTYGNYPMMSQQWTINDGLPVNTLVNIIQAKNGYIWFTTYDGLIRFDGIQFTIFNSINTPSLPSNRFLNLFEDDQNRIWITSENGYLIYYEKGEFKAFKFGTPESAPLTWSVLNDSKGGIWIGADDGIYHYTDYQMTQVYQNQGSRDESITALHEHSDGTIIAASRAVIHVIRNNIQHRIFLDFLEYDTHFIRAIHELENGDVLVGTSKGVFKVYPGSVEQRFENTPVANYPIRIIEKTKNGELLIAFDNGVYVGGNNGASQFFPIIPQITDNHVKRHFVDHEGRIWLITSAGKTYVYNGTSLTEGPFSEDFLRYRLESIIQDHEGNYWAATQFGGVMRLKPRIVFNFTRQHGLSHHNISGVTQAPDGCIWASTLDEGLNRICNGNVTHYSKENSKLNSDNIRTVAVKNSGEVYIGYFHDGYNILNTDGSIISVRDTTNFTRNQINSFYFEENGDIWIGTNGGIKHISNGTYKYISSSDGLPHNFVRYIIRDQKGYLWVATNGGGVAKIKDDDIIIYNLSNGLGSNSIRSIYPDPYIDGAIWIGSEDRGLSLIHNNKITRFTTEIGLFDNVIHKIIEDDAQRLWMSTNRGIFYVDKEDLLRFSRGESTFIKSISFTRDEGMDNPETNGGTQQAGFISKTRELVFPSQNGLVYLFPDNITLNKIPPFKHIESIIADGVPFNIYGPITLPAGVRNIEIRYTGISLTSPTQNQFKTKLLPTERSYLNTVNSRNRYFTFLAPGHYTFSVIASNNHGFWSDEPVNLLFTIKPYFWQTNLFHFISAIFFLLILYVGYKMRFNMLENRKELLQKLVEERTKELQKEKENALQQKKIIENQAKELESANSTKDKFFSIIAHDLRGAFHGIHGLTGIMSEEAESNKLPNMKMYSDAVHASSKNVNDLLTNLLSWARLQSKNVNVNLQNVDLSEVVSQNINLYENAIKNKDLTIKNHLSEPVIVETDLNMVDLILRNLISNSIKFCLQGCTISIELGDATQNTISLIVRDSGVGIPPEKVEHIFKFSANKSTRGTQDEPGTGLGLNLCYELMQMLNGDISVDSSLGVGTTFTLTFPK